MKKLLFVSHADQLARAVFYLGCVMSLFSLLVLSGCAGVSGRETMKVSAEHDLPDDVAGPGYVELSVDEQPLIARNDLSRALFKDDRKTRLFSARYQRRGWTGTYDIPVLLLLQQEPNKQGDKLGDKLSLLVSILDATGLNYGTIRLDSNGYETLKVLHPRLQGLLADCAEALRIIFLTAQPLETDKKLLSGGNDSASLTAIRPLTWRDGRYFLAMSYESPDLLLSKKSLYEKIDENGGSGREFWRMHATWKESQTPDATLPANIDLSVWGNYALKLELIK